VAIIRFPDAETEKRALGFLARRFPGKSYATGETVVPETALTHLALEGIKFTVEGTATYERLTPLRDTEDHRRFFREFKERLKIRFRQIDIWMTTHLIDVV
jgi:hypothetical protein